jgi:hypothetical protein
VAGSTGDEPASPPARASAVPDDPERDVSGYVTLQIAIDVVGSVLELSMVQALKPSRVRVTAHPGSVGRCIGFFTFPPLASSKHFRSSGRRGAAGGPDETVVS